MLMKTAGKSCALLLLLVALAGCRPEPARPPAAESAAAHDSAQAPFDSSKIPDSADAAVRTVLDGIRQKRPEAIWHFLPATYQKDVNDVVHEFAQRMDPELWSKAVALLDKLARVAKAQNGLLVATINPPAKPGEPAKSVDYEGLANLLQTLVKSELGNLEKLKTADAGAILAVTGGQFLEQLQILSKFGPRDSGTLPIDELSKLKVELKSSDGDQAVVLIRSPEETPRDTEFVRVEGKWIPRNLAESWIETIGLAKARLSLLSPENLAAQKPRWMTLIATFDGVLDQLAAARNKDEFAGALSGMYLPGMALMGMLQQPVDSPDQGPADESAPADETTPGPGAEKLVTIVVRQKLDSATQDELLERLKSALGRTEDVFAELTGDDESTSFRVGPVADLDEFAKKLAFLKILEVDANDRRITATIAK